MAHLHRSSLNFSLLVMINMFICGAITNIDIYLPSFPMPHPQTTPSASLSLSLEFIYTSLAFCVHQYYQNPIWRFMATHTKNHVLSIYTFVLLFDYNFSLIFAYRPHKIQPPAPVRPLIKSSPPPPAPSLTKATLHIPTQALIKSSRPQYAPALTESTPEILARALTNSNLKVRALIKSNPKLISARISRYKKIQTDAYRPTSPGNSPGMGHDVPPRG